MKKLLSFALMLALVFTVAACDLDDDGEDWFEDNEIVGIEPGAGIMAATEDAIEVYGLDFELVDTSDPVMVAELSQAIANEEWVVVTGWEPHYKFADHDLKFLEDPEGVFGDVENIHTIARAGIEDDLPELVEFFENFYLDSEELGDLMGMIEDYRDDEDIVDIARMWMDDNEDVWTAWLPEDHDGDGEEVNLDYVNWAEGIAMNYLAEAILVDELNYDVESTEGEPGVVFASLASGDADFFLDGWLPVTHESYMDEYGDDVVDLGYNFEGARIGLVVPDYVEIDSIEEMVRD